MNESQKEVACNFCEMCGCTMDIAVAYLQCCDWNIEGGKICDWNIEGGKIAQ